MITEESMIPYQATNLTGKRTLVFAPHPDDETIGCGGSLVLHVRAGDPVKAVFLTNGAKGDATGKMEKEAYVALRRKEAKEACGILGVKDLEFWEYEDRELAGARGALKRVMDLLECYEPGLVYAPSPLEFHPDHRAAAFLVCDAIRSCSGDFDLAFYEVGQPLSVNCLVDITAVLTLKQEAIAIYQSQLKERPYDQILMALNRFRSLTLPDGVTHAEGFSLWRSDFIRKLGPHQLPIFDQARLAPGESESGPLVSVIVRTKDRPGLLVTALRSIVAQTYRNIEIVAVNDGGRDVKALVVSLAGDVPVTYVDNQPGLGRSAAANVGFKASKGLYVCFLDDDDMLYPEHVETLVQHLRATDGKVVYSGVLNVYLKGPQEGPHVREKEEVAFNRPFDPDLLLFENYIPLMSVVLHREVFERTGGFREDMDLFEDWDLWVRISREFEFHHVNRVTAEYRFYNVADVEASYRDKYRYDEAQAAFFERMLPHLSGRAWMTFLKEGLVARLRSEVEKMGKGIVERDSRLKQADEWLQEFKGTIEGQDKKLREAEERIRNQVLQIESKDRMLQEIFHSKGWLWLTRYRRVKQKLLPVGRPLAGNQAPTDEPMAYRVKIMLPVKEKRKRVVHALANLMTGGSSRLVVDLIEHLGHKYDQTVITSFVPRPPAYEGVGYREYSRDVSPDEIHRFLKEEGTSLLHVHYWGDYDEPWYRNVFEAARGLPCAVIENVNTPVDPYVDVEVDRYVYVSQYAMHFGTPVDGKSTVIYPGSNLEMFQRGKAPIPDDTIGMVYRLEPDKLREDSIEVFIGVVKKRPRTKVYIIGGGKFLDPYRKRVMETGVSENFTFTGYVGYERLPEYYRKLSLFVAPVWKESFGQVSPFAMSMKIPVVGYDVGALSEILAGKECLAESTDELVALIIRLLDDKRKRIEIGERNFRRVVERFSVKNMVKCYDELYETLLVGLIALGG